MIINDKYKISGRMAKTYERMLEISEFIINLEKRIDPNKYQIAPVA